MLKKELRKKYKAFRQQLTEQQLEDKSLAIANRILELDVWAKTYFHLFISIGEHNEVDTEFILQVLAGKDRNIVVSKSDFATLTMTHYLLTDNTKFEKTPYNIFEPVDGLEVPDSKIDVVFVPLLAYDKLGHRVGYGKGFYDSFLAKCRADVVKIGLSFFEPEDVIEDVFETDIPLDYCVTPTAIYDFRRPSS